MTRAAGRYLADKSVWARARQPMVMQVLRPLVESGLVATCWMVDLEILYSVRDGPEHDDIRAQRRGLDWVPIPDEVGERAVAVQGLLAHRSRHRRVPLPDLVIAATAERHGLIVLHYDADFDLIAGITGQPTRWVLPRGEAD